MAVPNSGAAGAPVQAVEHPAVLDVPQAADPVPAPRFGTIQNADWQAEHERVTRTALACNSTFEPTSKPAICFEPKTISNLAGGNTGWGAVGAADNAVIHFSGGPDYWHCDGGDYLDTPGYPRTRAQATSKLDDCWDFARAMLTSGLTSRSTLEPNCRALQSHLSYRCEGVTEVVHLMITNGKIDVSQPGTHSAVGGCSFNGSKGRIKCLVLQQFGYALHAIQDFYSHSNYTDINTKTPYTATNPPGVGGDGPVGYWDLTQSTPPAIPSPLLSTGCFPDSKCEAAGRTNHETLNKDKGTIRNNPYDGVTIAPRTPRGQMINNGQTNFGRAVRGAIRQTRATWNQLSALIINREGAARGRMIICAIASDTPDDCK